MTTPAISVALPVYNAGLHLAAAVSSILGQSFRDFEIIAVDDGSTDDSRAILEAYAARDPRVRVISRPNTGIVGALNDACRAARAPLVARMDADDIAFPDRFALQVAFLETRPDVVALGASVIYIDSAGHPVKPCPRATAHEELEAALLAGDGGSLIHPVVMFRRTALEAVGYYRREAQYVEDLDIYLRLARCGRLANLPEPLLFYRVHSTSINFTKNAGRWETKMRVLADAHRERGLPFEPAALQPPTQNWADLAAHDRDWAVTALQYGRRGVALRHAIRACRLQPLNRDAWRCLAYALRAPKPSFPTNVPRPDWFN
jgi:glycosyltransferase involved in cell wall biosynthesis